MVSESRFYSGITGTDTFRADTKLLAAAAVYIVATLTANYTAMWFVPFPVFGMVAVGTLLFGVTFTQRDRVHHAGRRAVYVMIAVTAIMNSIEAALLGIPGRIILASFTAIVLAEMVDTEIYQRYIGRRWLERVLRSNAASIPLDSILFNTIAFSGVFPAMMLVSIVFGEIVIKTLTGVVACIRH